MNKIERVERFILTLELYFVFMCMCEEGVCVCGILYMHVLSAFCPCVCIDAFCRPLCGACVLCMLYAFLFLM